jgi:thiol:disulfide interchange protein DsbD
MFKVIRSCICIAILFFAAQVYGQVTPPLSFAFNQQRVSATEVLLSVKVKVQPGIKLYTTQKSEADLMYSAVTFDTSFKKYLSGSVNEQGNIKTEKDAQLNADVQFVNDSLEWKQKINIPQTDSVVIKGSINYSYKSGEEFLSEDKPIKFYIKGEPLVAEKNSSEGIATGRSLWWIFLTAFGGGLLALLTPCVYSMIPITVSFFTKRGKTRAEGIRNASYYSLSIIIIFTLLGFLITLIFGPAALNNLATNWVANLIFFAVFLVFGISFLGAFEIALPSSWATKTDTHAGMHNFLGIFFMALTLVMVSFSCTGPIIGNLLVLAAKGSYFGPLVGMFAFSLALALPFALFAIFPGMLNKLGKSGGWLNSIKVTLGFLELALALKFLSNADLVKGWRFLDREIFISLWIVIFALLGLYLLGKLKFHHDDELPKNDFGHSYLKIPRLFFAIGVFTLSVYMIPGLWGAPLKGISAFLPPMGTQDYVGSSASVIKGEPAPALRDNAPPHPQKYADVMKMYEPDVVRKYGMITYFDYNEALAVARKLKKPLMLDFTGINCVNCRKMETQVWSDEKVMQRLKDNFIIVSLYVDVQNIDLPENEQYFSTALDKQVETLGDKHADLQVTKFGANTQPYYFFLDDKENRLSPEGYGYDPDVNKFIRLLDEVSEAYKKNQ